MTPSVLTHAWVEMPITSLDIKNIQASVDALTNGLVDVKLQIKECYHETYWYDSSCSHEPGGLIITGWKPLPPDVVKHNKEREAERVRKVKEDAAKRKAVAERNAQKKFNKLAKDHAALVKSLKEGGDIVLPLSKVTPKIIWDANEIKKLVKKYPHLLENYEAQEKSDGTI